MNTDTAHELTTISTRFAASRILFGGESNPYYADQRTRQIVTRVRSNSHGQYVAELGVGRLINYADEPCELVSRIEYQSPLFDNADSAYAWAETAEFWAVRYFTGQVFGQRPPLVTEAHSHCTSCDHFDTLTTELQAYGNLTTCTTPGCGHNDWYSIGD